MMKASLGSLVALAMFAVTLSGCLDGDDDIESGTESSVEYRDGALSCARLRSDGAYHIAGCAQKTGTWILTEGKPLSIDLARNTTGLAIFTNTSVASNAFTVSMGTVNQTLVFDYANSLMVNNGAPFGTISRVNMTVSHWVLWSICYAPSLSVVLDGPAAPSDVELTVIEFVDNWYPDQAYQDIPGSPSCNGFYESNGWSNGEFQIQ